MQAKYECAESNARERSNDVGAKTEPETEYVAYRVKGNQNNRTNAYNREHQFLFLARSTIKKSTRASIIQKMIETASIIASFPQSQP